MLHLSPIQINAVLLNVQLIKESIPQKYLAAQMFSTLVNVT